MKADSGASVSVWAATTEVIRSSGPLTRDTIVDVCVVGAGISGLTTAYLLAREGKSVVVLDDGPIGGGMTGRTTAHLVTALDDRFYELERLHGSKGARLAAESHRAAIELVEEISIREQIDCDFERLDGFLFNPPGESSENLQQELEAAHRAGLSDVELVARAPIGDFDTGPALRFPNQAQLHPLKLLGGLSQAILRSGGHIHTQTHATSIEGGMPARVESKGGYIVTCDAIVVATNTPVNDRLVIHLKQAPYITYVSGFRVPRDSVQRALFWDTSYPYHYVRLQTPEDQPYELLIVGGEDHKTGQAQDFEERFIRLEDWTRERFPMAGEVSYQWSGQVLEPFDGLAFIGRNPLDEENVYIATGDSGNGMTHGVIAGKLITDLIMESENRWETLYDPRRKTLRALPKFASENLNVAAQYADYLAPGEVDSVDEIPPTEGATMTSGLSKAAVYRDESGALHEFSAMCPHLACLVNWNSEEKTWDCPCHGSRFDAHGRVVQGPANEDLAPLKD